jgi:uncharacterized membrane protein
MHAFPDEKEPAMYSKAKILGHPIHPALVAFPIAFYVATFVALVVFAVARDPFWFHVAAWTGLAGVVMATIAAVPGLIDAVSIPHGTRAWKTALAHGLLNSTTLVLFLIATISMWFDWQATLTPRLDVGLPLILSAIGVLLLLGAGALGWTLVQTYHVGVTDPLVPDAAAPRAPAPPAPTLPGMGELRPTQPTPHHP